MTGESNSPIDPALNIERAAYFLERTNVRLQNRARLIFAFSLVELVATVGVLAFRAYPYVMLELVLFVLMIGLGSALFSLGLLVAYESDRRRGTVYFEEVSDALQVRRLAAQRPEHKKTDDGSIPDDVVLRARIAFRTFTVTTDLPLVPGRYGISFYALFDIAAALLAVAAASRY